MGGGSPLSASPRLRLLRDGQWAGALDSAQSIAGLTSWRQTVLSLSRANKTGDEAHPFLGTVFGKGKVATVLANGWEWGLALDA